MEERASHFRNLASAHGESYRQPSMHNVCYGYCLRLVEISHSLCAVQNSRRVAASTRYIRVLHSRCSRRCLLFVCRRQEGEGDCRMTTEGSTPRGTQDILSVNVSRRVRLVSMSSGTFLEYSRCGAASGLWGVPGAPPVLWFGISKWNIWRKFLAPLNRYYT